MIYQNRNGLILQSAFKWFIKKSFYGKISESKCTFDTKSFTEVVTEHLMKFEKKIYEYFSSLGKENLQTITYLGRGALCHDTPWRSLIREIRDRFKVKNFFYRLKIFSSSIFDCGCMPLFQKFSVRHCPLSYDVALLQIVIYRVSLPQTSVRFYFISIFILLPRRKATEALIHRVGNYLDLLPDIPRYCCPLVI